MGASAHLTGVCPMASENPFCVISEMLEYAQGSSCDALKAFVLRSARTKLSALIKELEASK